MCPLAIAVQTTPLRSISMPRGENPLTGVVPFIGGSYTSASVVSGGFEPGTSRMTAPGKPR